MKKILFFLIFNFFCFSVQADDHTLYPIYFVDTVLKKAEPVSIENGQIIILMLFEVKEAASESSPVTFWNPTIQAPLEIPKQLYGVHLVTDPQEVKSITGAIGSVVSNLPVKENRETQKGIKNGMPVIISSYGKTPGIKIANVSLKGFFPSWNEYVLPLSKRQSNELLGAFQKIFDFFDIPNKDFFDFSGDSIVSKAGTKIGNTITPEAVELALKYKTGYSEEWGILETTFDSLVKYIWQGDYHLRHMWLISKDRTLSFISKNYTGLKASVPMKIFSHAQVYDISINEYKKLSFDQKADFIHELCDKTCPADEALTDFYKVQEKEFEKNIPSRTEEIQSLVDVLSLFENRKKEGIYDNEKLSAYVLESHYDSVKRTYIDVDQKRVQLHKKQRITITGQWMGSLKKKKLIWDIKNVPENGLSPYIIKPEISGYDVSVTFDASLEEIKKLNLKKGDTITVSGLLKSSNGYAPRSVQTKGRVTFNLGIAEISR